MTSELACRKCSRTGVRMTTLYKADGTGALVPVEGVCHECSRPAPAPDSSVMRASRPSTCAHCRGEIIQGDRIIRTEPGGWRVWAHAGCAPPPDDPREFCAPVPSRCKSCGVKIPEGDPVVNLSGKWMHPACAPAG
jgi:hypothetical protein